MLQNKKEIVDKWEITDQGEDPHIIVRIQILQDQTHHRITIHQGAYIRCILDHFGMANLDTIAMPMDNNSKLVNATEEDLFEHPTLYWEAIGALLYASMGTRPDITYAVQTLSQFASKPSKDHWWAVKRVLQYLQGTKDLGMTYDDTNSFADIHVSRYSDTDWASLTINHWSISGYVFTIVRGAVAWSSKKQPTVALSLMEAEYMASSNVTTQAIWLWKLFNELNFIQSSPAELLLDDQSAIVLASNPQFHPQSKHINIWHHFIRSCISDGQVQLYWCLTDKMIVDILTKPLAYPKFNLLSQSLGMLAPV